MRDAIDPWMLGGALAREKRHGQVEAAPEKVDRAALAHEVRAVVAEDGLDLHQDMPEALRVDRIVGGVDLVDITANGILYLVGQGVDGDLDAQGVQAVHELAVK